MANWIKLGNLEVTTIPDGVLHDSTGIISNLDARSASALSESTPGQELRLPVNCFLARRGNLVCLVDTGAGTSLQPTLGRMPANLEAAGVDPGTVRHVLLTHLHPDHANGLLTVKGAPAFPAAEIHLHEEEAAFWLDQPIADGLPKARQDRMRTNRMLLAPYCGRIRRSADGEILPGVAVRSYAGHSPGHACWTVEGVDAKVLFWGDIVHVPAVQVPYPEVCIVYDYDSIAAAASRRRLFAEIADTPTIIAGAHLDAFYRLSSGSDGYRLEPIEVCGAPFPS